MSDRTLPNILITGTPGTGKSTLAEQLADKTALKLISVNQLASQGQFFDGYDAERHCSILDEDRLLDEMEPMMQSGGQIVDYHSCEFFPERWFDAVFVLRSDNTILHPRLQSRGYSADKVMDLIHCEIVQVILDEARESYQSNIVHELPSNTIGDLEDNIARICAWVDNWIKNKPI